MNTVIGITVSFNIGTIHCWGVIAASCAEYGDAPSIGALIDNKADEGLHISSPEDFYVPVHVDWDLSDDDGTEDFIAPSSWQRVPLSAFLAHRAGDDEIVTDYLSDRTGWLVSGWSHTEY